MIKITGINRKTTCEKFSNADETVGGLRLVVSHHTCNAVLATDEFFNKGHFSLTEDESRAFDDLCERVQSRIVRDIGNGDVGILALLPKVETTEAPLKANVAGGSV